MRGAVMSLAIAAAAFASQDKPPAPPPAPGPFAFVIDLDTAGGFAGMGRGGVTIRSDGSVRATRSGLGRNRDASGCRAQLTAAALEPVQRAVAGATRQPWPPTVTPPADTGCCDRFKFTLRVQTRGADGGAQTFQTTWFDGNEKYLPADLAALKDSAVGVLTRTLADCGK